MALLRRSFYRKPPDRLLEITNRLYVFDICFSTDVLEEAEFATYLSGIVAQLQDYYPDAYFKVINFGDGTESSQISSILSHYDMKVVDYPRQYGGSPLLPLEMINNFLRSCKIWLTLAGQQNVLLMHCDRGGWPVLAFMLAGFLLYIKLYDSEQKTLEMLYNQAPQELFYLMSPVNPQPSQLRYLQYYSSGKILADCGHPSGSPLGLNCIVLRVLPLFDGGKGCRPIVRVYGQDPSLTSSNGRSKLLFSTAEKHSRLYQPEECGLVKLDVDCRVDGDVVIECVHSDDDFTREEMMFRIMFHTAFVRFNVLKLNRDEVDVLWDGKDKFSQDFRAEVRFYDADARCSENDQLLEYDFICSFTSSDVKIMSLSIEDCSLTTSVTRPPRQVGTVTGALPRPDSIQCPSIFSVLRWFLCIPSLLSCRRATNIESSDEIMSEHIPSQGISETGFPDISEMVVSLTDEEEAITNRLMRGTSQRDIVTIVGMPGIGKTTLAKKVYDDPKIALHFHRRAWCSVSREYGKMELLLDIIRGFEDLPDNVHQMTDADLELALMQILS